MKTVLATSAPTLETATCCRLMEKMFMVLLPVLTAGLFRGYAKQVCTRRANIWKTA
jgi:hypothetical protein